MNMSEYIPLCKQKSYELKKSHPNLKHSKLLDLAAKELGFKHFTTIVKLEKLLSPDVAPSTLAIIQAGGDPADSPYETIRSSVTSSQSNAIPMNSNVTSNQSNATPMRTAMKRKAIPEKIKKALYKESGMLCSMCGEDDFATFEMHHIEPYSEVKEHTLENMILLCSSCHSKITAGNIPDKDIYKLKIQLANGNHPYINKSSDSKESNIINFSDHSVNKGIVAKTVNVKVAKAPKITQAPPSGSIASSLIHKNYIKYLIDRYHEFKLADVGKSRMKYPVFYQAIKRQFKSKWDHVDLKNFDSLAYYIQNRIEKTILGKNSGKCYSTFEEYKNK